MIVEEMLCDFNQIRADYAPRYSQKSEGCTYFLTLQKALY